MMETRAFIEDASRKFSSEVLSFVVLSEKRANITIHPAAILKITEFIFKESKFRFVIATAVHTRKGFEIYYHFSYDPSGLILNIHTILPAENPEIESLANLFDAANWVEREMHELFGITFLGHPDPSALLSDGNWAAGEYPYRKNAKELKME